MNDTFWKYQPIDHQHNDGIINKVLIYNPHPEILPEGLIWSEIDVNQYDQLCEVYEFLSNHYLENVNGDFRVLYPKEYIKNTMSGPGNKVKLNLLVRYGGKIYAMISGKIITVMINNSQISTLYVDYLTIHKNLRGKRLAPIMINEIKRRAIGVDKNIQMAVFSTSKLITTFLVKTPYYHYPLNVTRLMKYDFWPKIKINTKTLIKLYGTNIKTKYNWINVNTGTNVERICELFNSYNSQGIIGRVFSVDECRHILTGPIWCYTCGNNLISWYQVNNQHSKSQEIIKIAHVYAIIVNDLNINDILDDLKVMTSKAGFDVINIVEGINLNENILTKAKFKLGNGALHYSLYNYSHKKITPDNFYFVIP